MSEKQKNYKKVAFIAGLVVLGLSVFFILAYLMPFKTTSKFGGAKQSWSGFKLYDFFKENTDTYKTNYNILMSLSITISIILAIAAVLRVSFKTFSKLSYSIIFMVIASILLALTIWIFVGVGAHTQPATPLYKRGFGSVINLIVGILAFVGAGLNMFFNNIVFIIADKKANKDNGDTAKLDVTSNTVAE